MKLSDFNYNLPEELIANHPACPRDSSRLLVLDKKTGAISHEHFFDFPKHLTSNDVLVFNDTKVFPARLESKKESGGKVEILLVREKDKYTWHTLLKGRNLNVGTKLVLPKNVTVEILNKHRDDWLVKFSIGSYELRRLTERIGIMPTPPYIKSALHNKDDYQTIYAADDKNMSVAAPTAGFHFTERIFKALEKKGVQKEFITLHVGPGTFLPVRTEDITDHKMHAEYAEANLATVARLMQYKKDGKRIIAVGTTSVRVLEMIGNLRKPEDFIDYIDLFIYPPYKFKMVDALLTNFHLPKSTLLMLVSALAGKKNIDKAYAAAINKKYRFYSFGDAMFIK
ncbi:MAG: tRNA preQ1(34) S-adenosylmethionine ribosyltransferase-isomerase QueA [bacterium]